MKKLAALVFAVFLFSGFVFSDTGKVILNLYGNFLNLAKNSYTDQDSQNKVFFEAKAAVSFQGNMYLWASHGHFPLRDGWTSWDAKSSFAKDIRVERSLAKTIIAGGWGFFAGYFAQDQFAVRTEIGICSIRNIIDSTINDMDTGEFLRVEKASQAGIGVRGNLAFTYGFFKNIFGEVSMGYTYAADKIDDVRSNLGGFHLAMGLGIQL